MARKRPGLGKGLDALIPPQESDLPPGSVRQIPIEDIQSNPRQPRAYIDAEELTELASSIREHGILQPLIVTQQSEGNEYVLIAGERRLQAARQAGLSTVPALVREASEREMIELALIENIQRADLNPLEAAEAYQQLVDDFGLSHEELAAQLGKSRSAVTNTLRLLKLPETIRAALARGDISEGHARALLGLSTPQAQTAALKAVIDRGLNVRQTEALVRKMNGERPASQSKSTLPPELTELEGRLRSTLGTKVRLTHSKKGGTIIIHYYSTEELDAIIDRLLDQPT
jgi:ParB family chromosome partitioning protein